MDKSFRVSSFSTVSFGTLLSPFVSLRVRILGVVVVTLGLWGCAGDSQEPDDSPEPEAVVEETCQGIKVDLDVMADSPQRTFNDFSVTISEADPVVPDRGDNTFTFLLKNNDDTPHVHIGEVLLSPFMPDHGHGSLPLDFSPQVQSDRDAGKFIFGPMDLFMLGRWDLHFRLLHEDGSETDAVFTFCIEG